MPRFEIHDSETGLKLLVEGDKEPSYEETVRLFDDELSFLRTNIYRGPDNRFMLDVGPSAETRRVSEGVPALISQYDDIIAAGDWERAAIDRAHQRMTEFIESGGKLPEGGIPEFWQALLADERLRVPKPQPSKPAPTQTEKTLTKLDPNTLLIVSHGAETGGLSTEGGLDFQLHNVAQALGSYSNAIRNVINVACYGGKCMPEQYQAAFPNVTNVQHADLNVKNTISIQRLAEGQYFWTNTVPGVWRQHGTNWYDVEQVPQEREPTIAVDQEP